LIENGAFLATTGKRDGGVYGQAADAHLSQIVGKARKNKEGIQTIRTTSWKKGVFREEMSNTKEIFLQFNDSGEKW